MNTLQQVSISEIRGLDKRVRQQMNPEKLEELSASIEELGQLVPIKVRKNGSGYVLIYGHRRVMAAKAAGLKEIEALVSDVADDKVLTQSLAENVIREDMAAIDIAKALQHIKDDTGASDEALGRRLGWERKKVNDYLGLLEPNILKAMSGDRSPLGVRHALEAKTAGDSKLAARVLQKASDEDLSTRETRQVAGAVKRAAEFGGDKAVRQVLSQPVGHIMSEAPTYRPTRQPLVGKVSGRISFSWTTNQEVVLLERVLKSSPGLVKMIARSSEDKGGGKAALKRVRAMAAGLVDQIDKVLR